MIYAQYLSNLFLMSFLYVIMLFSSLSCGASSLNNFAPTVFIVLFSYIRFVYWIDKPSLSSFCDHFIAFKSVIKIVAKTWGNFLWI